MCTQSEKSKQLVTKVTMPCGTSPKFSICTKIFFTFFFFELQELAMYPGDNSSMVIKTHRY